MPPVVVVRRVFPYKVLAQGIATPGEIKDWFRAKCASQGEINIWRMHASGTDKYPCTIVDGITTLPIQGFHCVYRRADGTHLDPLAVYDTAQYPWREGGPLDAPDLSQAGDLSQMSPDDVMSLPAANATPPAAIIWPLELKFDDGSKGFQYQQVKADVVERALDGWQMFDLLFSEEVAGGFAIGFVALWGTSAGNAAPTWIWAA